MGKKIFSSLEQLDMGVTGITLTKDQIIITVMHHCLYYSKQIAKQNVALNNLPRHP